MKVLALMVVLLCTTLGKANAEEWVYIYFTVKKGVPVLFASDRQWKSQIDCGDNNFGLGDETGWRVPLNWLDEDQRRPVRGHVGSSWPLASAGAPTQ